MTPLHPETNATSPIVPAVLEAMLRYLREHFGNQSSSHAYGKRSNHALKRAVFTKRDGRSGRWSRGGLFKSEKGRNHGAR